MNFEYCKKERADLVSLKSKKVADFITSYYKHKITSGEWPTDDGRRSDKGSSDNIYPTNMVQIWIRSKNTVFGP